MQSKVEDHHVRGFHHLDRPVLLRGAQGPVARPEHHERTAAPLGSAAPNTRPAAAAAPLGRAAPNTCPAATEGSVQRGVQRIPLDVGSVEAVVLLGPFVELIPPRNVLLAGGSLRAGFEPRSGYECLGFRV